MSGRWEWRNRPYRWGEEARMHQQDRVWVESPPIAEVSEFDSPESAEELRGVLSQIHALSRGRRGAWAERELERLLAVVRAAQSRGKEWVAERVTAPDDYWHATMYANSTTGATTASAASTRYLTSAIARLRREMLDQYSVPWELVKEERQVPADIYSNRSYSFTQSILCVEVAANRSAYWAVDGDIPPERVALLLPRYYATRERVQLLFRERRFPNLNSPTLTAKHLHPDPQRLEYDAAVDWIDTHRFIDATRGQHYTGRTFVWERDKWKRGTEDGYVELNPFADE